MRAVKQSANCLRSSGILKTEVLFSQDLHGRTSAFCVLWPLALLLGVFICTDTRPGTGTWSGQVGSAPSSPPLVNECDKTQVI